MKGMIVMSKEEKVLSILKRSIVALIIILMMIYIFNNNRITQTTPVDYSVQWVIDKEEDLQLNTGDLLFNDVGQLINPTLINDDNVYYELSSGSYKIILKENNGTSPIIALIVK